MLFLFQCSIMFIAFAHGIISLIFVLDYWERKHGKKGCVSVDDGEV